MKSFFVFGGFCEVLAVCWLVLLPVLVSAQQSGQDKPTSPLENLPTLGSKLTDSQVVMFADLALKNIQTEYPNKPSNVVVDKASVRTPKEMHPAFYGCFDWHSSVHGHWMLIKLLKEFPNSSADQRIREKLNQNLTAENLAAELAYFEEKQHKSFERTYGCLLYTSPSPRDRQKSRMPSSA